MGVCIMFFHVFIGTRTLSQTFRVPSSSLSILTVGGRSAGPLPSIKRPFSCFFLRYTAQSATDYGVKKTAR